MQELSWFSHLVLHSEAMKYSWVGCSTFSMYVHELLCSGFNNEIAPKNTEILDKDFFSQNLVGYFRDKTGEIIRTHYVLSNTHH